MLTELVMAWSASMRAASSDDLAPVAEAGASTPAQAAKLAQELARLMDMVETENVSLDGLKTLVPDDFSEHWGKTLDFLKIIVEMWPAVSEGDRPVVGGRAAQSRDPGRSASGSIRCRRPGR